MICGKLDLSSSLDLITDLAKIFTERSISLKSKQSQGLKSNPRKCVKNIETVKTSGSSLGREIVNFPENAGVFKKTLLGINIAQ